MIGFLTTEYPGLTANYGGIGTSIRDLARGLLNRKIIPFIFLVNDMEDVVQTLDGINIIRIKRKRLSGLTAYLTGKKISQVVNAFVKDGKIDVLEVPDWTGLSAFVKVNSPIVMRLNGSDTYFKHLEGKSSKFRYRFLERRAFTRANHLLSVSQYTSDITNHIFHSNREMDIIPNAVDSDLF
ncbi:MAG: glycosyltransferase family 4 protein, partial [Bacteroidota bacterium]